MVMAHDNDKHTSKCEIMNFTKLCKMITQRNNLRNFENKQNVYYILFNIKTNGKMFCNFI